MEKDPIEHKRGKGDSNSEKYIVFQDLKELIYIASAIKTIGNIANVKGYKMQEIENGDRLRRVFCILKKGSQCKLKIGQLNFEREQYLVFPVRFFLLPFSLNPILYFFPYSP